MEILRDNEEHIAKESKPKGKDDEGEEGMEDAEEEDSDNEFDSTLEKIQKLKKKGVDKAGEDEEEDIESEDDSDYDYTGGDLALYDSALDDIDELKYIKETFEHIN